MKEFNTYSMSAYVKTYISSRRSYDDELYHD